MHSIVCLFWLIAVVSAVKNWRECRIPNPCCVAIVFITVLKELFIQDMAWGEHILGSVVISIPMFLLALFFKGSFGGGDIKFTAACGFFLGWRVMLKSSVFAIGGAGIWAVLLLWKGYDKKTRFPLGPFLVFGMFVGTVSMY